MPLCCTLESKESRHHDIVLVDGEAVVLGRGPATKIKDSRCSRTHIEVTADYSARTVSVRQLGPSACSLKGNKLHQGECGVLKEGEELSFLHPDLFPYSVRFSNSSESVGSPGSTVSDTALVNDGKPESEDVTRPMSLRSNRKRPIVQTDRKKRTLDEYFGSDNKNPKAQKKSEVQPSDDVEEEERVNKIEAQLEEMRRGHTRTFSEEVPDMKSSSPRRDAEKEHAGSLHAGCSTGEQEWNELKDLMVFTPKGIQHQPKIAAFDLDWTIIATKTGKVFPAGPHDWKFLYPEVQSKLKQLHDDGYKLVFFSNQRGIDRGKGSSHQFSKKVEAIVSALEVPVQVFISISHGIYRKPAPGMWRYLEEVGNGNVPVDRAQSFFVGDAAGRPANWAPRKKKDFSTGDRMFALNLNLPFFTPEEYFLNQKAAEYSLPSFNPRQLPSSTSICDEDKNITSTKQEVILLVGLPGTGKSHFANTYLIPSHYVHINRDILGNWQRCLAKCEEAVKAGKSVVIDNTNVTIESRSRYVECAKTFGVQCRCFTFNINAAHAMHNIKFRGLIGTDKVHQQVNTMVFNSIKSKYQDPNISEGYTEILKINFIPIFDSNYSESLYKMYLSEK